jgi:predicted MFS family arabinose efflux permease
VLPFAWLSLPTLMLCSVLVGLGFLPYHLGNQKLVSELGPPEERRHNLSLLTIGFSVSSFIGPTTAGFLIDGFGHRFAFGVLAVLPVGAFLWIRHLRARLPTGRLLPPGRAQSLKIRDLLSTPELRRLYVVVALVSSAWDVHQFLVPLYGASIGLSASGIGLVLGAFALATLIVRMVVPLFLMDVPEWYAILAAIGIAAAVYALYPWFDSLESLLLLSFVLGLGLGVSQPMTLSILARSAPASRLGDRIAGDAGQRHADRAAVRVRRARCRDRRERPVLGHGARARRGLGRRRARSPQGRSLTHGRAAAATARGSRSRVRGHCPWRRRDR